MNWMDECAAIVPCLNEQAAIGSLVTAVRHHVATVIVVDDGSTDETAMVAQQAGATVLRHQQPLGKGAALQTGWTKARDLGLEWALTLDGDGQHSADDIPAFFACAEKTSALLIVGNRMDRPRGMPLVRRLVNRWMSARISKLAGCPLPDSQSGFRLMNLRAWSALQITAAHFEIESEVLLAFAQAGHRIDFVPIRVIYESEASKIHPWRDTWRWFQWQSHAKKPGQPRTGISSCAEGRVKKIL